METKFVYIVEDTNGDESLELLKTTCEQNAFDLYLKHIDGKHEDYHILMHITKESEDGHLIGYYTYSKNLGKFLYGNIR